jgi:hypothetical protein
MSVNAPFTPTGNTIVFTANVSAPTPVQVPTTGGLGSNQYRIINSGSSLVFLGYGANATVASSGAVAPTTTQNNCLALLPGTDEIITFIPNAYFTGITVSGNATIYIVAGDGD